jgi:hypothetical protein
MQGNYVYLADITARARRPKAAQNSGYQFETWNWDTPHGVELVTTLEENYVGAKATRKLFLNRTAKNNLFAKQMVELYRCVP